MSHVLLTHQHSEFAPRARRGGLHLKMGPMGALILMMGLIGFMGLLSLTYLNAQSTKGYMINKLEDDQQDLVSDREINDMLILQARSIKNIETHPQVQAMVRPNQITYFEPIVGLASAN